MNLQDEFPKKTLFWKYMIVALQAMEQEYELYERLAKDRRFDMSRHLGKTVERFYQAAATGYQPDEKYILAVEESYFEPRDEYEKLAYRIVKDLEDFSIWCMRRIVKRPECFWNVRCRYWNSSVCSAPIWIWRKPGRKSVNICPG